MILLFVCHHCQSLWSTGVTIINEVLNLLFDRYKFQMILVIGCTIGCLLDVTHAFDIDLTKSVSPPQDVKTSDNGDIADDQDDDRITIGDWIAQWDTEYEDWFYYNIITQQSTWIKPRELGHITFKRREETSGGKLDIILFVMRENMILKEMLMSSITRYLQATSY